jgi:hypothetical protein
MTPNPAVVATDADVSQFRAIVNFLIRQERRTLLRRLDRLLGSPWSAARLLVRAWRALRRHGLAVSAHYRVGVAVQMIQMIEDYCRYSFEPRDYYVYQLYSPERRGSRPRQFTTTSHVFAVQAHLLWNAPDRSTLADKSLFAKRCEELKLCSLPSLAEFIDGRMVGAEPADIPADDLFSKPTMLWYGRGARLWRHDGGGRFTDFESGEVYDKSAMLDELGRQSMSGIGPIILQRRVRNHPALAPLAPTALSTIRLVSCRSPSGGIDFLPPVLRIPLGRSVVDNFHPGGLAAPVDLPTGRICGPAVRFGPILAISKLENHPETGVALIGFVLPFWNETVALARRAHEMFGSLCFVGWDIAILADGPRLVEGNAPCGLDATLLSHGIVLADTQFIPYCHFHIERIHGRSPGR